MELNEGRLSNRFVIKIKLFKCPFYRRLYFTPLIIFLFIIFYIGSPFFSFEGTAEYKEFEIREFQDSKTIPPNKMVVLDIDFQKGNEIEVVFSVKERNNLPVDIWFVNEDNYLLLSGGAQFLFYIDGSQQQVSYTRKIVTLTEYDLYKLVITNYYNNQSVDVDLTYEIRTPSIESTETSSLSSKDSKDTFSFDSVMFRYILLTVIIILAVLVIVLGFKARSNKNFQVKVFNKTQKIHSSKPNKNKGKSPKKEISEKEKTNKKKKIQEKSSKREEPEMVKDISKLNSFCGHCGELVNTPFCRNCGYKV
jgi:hypothetical protein